MKSIFKAVAVVTLFSVLTRALGFLFRVFLTRKLGAEGIGLFQMSSSILGIFLTLVSSGLPLTTAKLVSKYEINNEFNKRNKTVTSSLIVAIILSILAGLIIYLARPIFNKILADNRAVSLLTVLIPSIIFSAVYSVFRGALWGQNDYFNCGLTELLEQIIRFVLTFIMLFSVSDIFVSTIRAGVAFNITCLISSVIVIILYFAKKGKLNFKSGEYKNVLKSATPVTGVRLANSLVQPLTTIIIPAMLVFSGYTKSEAVASFGVIMGMTFPMLFVPMAIIGSISMVLIPSISSLMSQGKKDVVEMNLSKALNVSVFISMIFIPLYLAVGDQIGLVLYNNAMSGVLLQLSAVCVLPITLCNITGSMLNALSLEVKSFVNYLIGSIILFLTLLLLTPVIGINAIIVAFFLSMTIISLLNLRKIKQVVPSLKFSLFSVLSKYTMLTIPCSLIGHFISNIFLNVFTNFFAGLIGGITTLTIQLILIKTFNIYDLRQFREILKRKRAS